VLKNSVTNNKLECGTDEAGRGCLAGPVTAAAVILPKKFKNKWLDDSKKLSQKKLEFLRPIIEKDALEFRLSHVHSSEIDKINILNASILAMHQAIEKLENVTFIAVDGNRFKPFGKVPHETVVKGDGKYLNIAAASILAKTYRDDYMIQIHEEFPMYNWKQNKGYPTKEHREAIKKYGPSKYHRKSFKLISNQLNFEF
tara:strand:- start:8150 stop:8746 length:597 start_codon:yes stop_codon:yes gene_type:complete